MKKWLSEKNLNALKEINAKLLNLNPVTYKSKSVPKKNNEHPLHARNSLVINPQTFKVSDIEQRIFEAQNRSKSSEHPSNQAVFEKAR